MEEIKRIACELLSILESTTDIDGIVSVTVAVWAPRELVAIINGEICGDDLPYPFSLKMLKKVLEAIGRVDDDCDIESIHREVEEIAAPLNTTELTAWLNAGEFNYRYCDEWEQSIGPSGTLNTMDLLAGGWSLQLKEVAVGLISEIQAYIESNSEQTELAEKRNER